MIEHHRDKKLTVGRFHHEVLLQEAIEEIASGKVIAFHILGVCGLLGDGARESTWDHILAIKKGKPKVRAAMVRHERVASLGIVDVDRIGHQGLKNLFTQNPAHLATIVGGKAHILYPISKEAEARVPSWMISRHATEGYGQFQVFEAHLTGIEPLLDTLHDHGVRYPVVTSLNFSGAGSITNPYLGIDFALRSGRISHFFIGDSSDRVGSFGRIHASDLSVLREGPEIPQVLDAIAAFG